MADSGAFRGKYLYVWAKEPLNAKMIEDPRIVELAGRRFIVGEYFGNPDKPGARDGCTTWVPVDDVLGLIEFHDRARVIQAAKEWGRPDPPAQNKK
jgi:hypothetical protein